MEAEGDDIGVGTAVARIDMRDERLKERLKELVATMKVRTSLRDELEARKATA